MVPPELSEELKQSVLTGLKRRPALFEQIFQGGMGMGMFFGQAPANAKQMGDLTTEDITFPGKSLARFDSSEFDTI